MISYQKCVIRCSMLNFQHTQRQPKNISWLEALCKEEREKKKSQPRTDRLLGEFKKHFEEAKFLQRERSQVRRDRGQGLRVPLLLHTTVKSWKTFCNLGEFAATLWLDCWKKKTKNNKINLLFTQGISQCIFAAE